MKNKEEIENIKKLYRELKSVYKVATLLKIPSSTIQYYVDDEYKVKCKERATKSWNNSPEEKKKQKYSSQREYQRIYRKERYKNDKSFRELLIERAKRYKQKKKNGLNNS